TIPTREHFKWLYTFLVKNGPLDLRKKSHTIAKYRGWTTETIDFMIKVFFELNFVKIENGLISIIKNSQKRDLQESKIYQQKQLNITLENEYLYSSYQHLKSLFEKEEVSYGFEKVCNSSSRFPKTWNSV